MEAIIELLKSKLRDKIKIQIIGGLVYYGSVAYVSHNCVTLTTESGKVWIPLDKIISVIE